MKILLTTTFIYGEYLEKLRSLGAPIHDHQFKIICKCRGIADANRKCKEAGLGDRVFVSEYSNVTTNEQHIDLCEKEDIWISRYGRKPNSDYISISELKKLDIPAVSS